MDKDRIDTIIDRALAEAASQHITGKRVTPFLLDRIKQLTGGASLTANIALVKHNAEVGAQLALALQSAVAHGVDHA
jgi:pseudouridine-5'-phosphate glycosidase